MDASSNHIILKYKLQHTEPKMHRAQHNISICNIWKDKVDLLGVYIPPSEIRRPWTINAATGLLQARKFNAEYKYIYSNIIIRTLGNDD